MLNLQSQDEGEQSFQFRLSTHLQAKTDSWFQLWFQMAFRSESCLSSACQNSKVPPLQVIIRHDAPWWQLKWLSLLQKEMLQVFSKLQLSPFGKFPQKFTICAFFAHGEPCGLSPGIMSDLRITMQRRRLQSHSAAFETRSKSGCEPKVSGRSQGKTIDAAKTDQRCGIRMSMTVNV